MHTLSSTSGYISSLQISRVFNTVHPGIVLDHLKHELSSVIPKDRRQTYVDFRGTKSTYSKIKHVLLPLLLNKQEPVHSLDPLLTFNQHAMNAKSKIQARNNVLKLETKETLTPSADQQPTTRHVLLLNNQLTGKAQHKQGRMNHCEPSQSVLKTISLPHINKKAQPQHQNNLRESFKNYQDNRVLRTRPPIINP